MHVFPLICHSLTTLQNYQLTSSYQHEVKSDLTGKTSQSNFNKICQVDQASIG